jgi:hypothetical protein
MIRKLLAMTRAGKKPLMEGEVVIVSGRYEIQFRDGDRLILTHHLKHVSISDNKQGLKWTSKESAPIAMSMFGFHSAMFWAEALMRLCISL